jgi:hypothetical protein
MLHPASQPKTQKEKVRNSPKSQRNAAQWHNLNLNLNLSQPDPNQDLTLTQTSSKTRSKPRS